MEISNGEKGFVGLSALMFIALIGAAYVSDTNGILGGSYGAIGGLQLESSSSSSVASHEKGGKLEALAGPLTKFKSRTSGPHEKPSLTKLESSPSSVPNTLLTKLASSSSSSVQESLKFEAPLTKLESSSSSVHSKLEELGGRYSLSEELLANLDKVLSEAAFHNRTVIITNLNQAWAAQGSMIDVFLKSFRVGDGTSSLLKHLVILAMDKASFERCVLVHSHCFALETEQVDFSGEKLFMSEDFVKMMWRRVQFMGLVLELGYNFIFTDADVLWLRDPFQHLSTSNADLEVACDLFLGDPADPHNAPNTGFLHVRASNRTIQLYKLWHSAKDTYPGLNEQMVLSEIRGTQGFQELGLNVRYLPTELFGGFCEAGKDLTKICTMHANCCAGLQNKIKDLRRILNDWKRFKAVAPHDRIWQAVQWTAPNKCLTSFQRVFQSKHKKGIQKKKKRENLF